MCGAGWLGFIIGQALWYPLWGGDSEIVTSAGHICAFIGHAPLRALSSSPTASVAAPTTYPVHARTHSESAAEHDLVYMYASPLVENDKGQIKLVDLLDTKEVRSAALHIVIALSLIHIHSRNSLSLCVVLTIFSFMHGMLSCIAAQLDELKKSLNETGKQIEFRSKIATNKAICDVLNRARAPCTLAVTARRTTFVSNKRASLV